MKSPTIGLLPLYIKLYDQSFSQFRDGMDTFHATIAKTLRQQGLKVLTVPICRVQREFKQAVRHFERSGVDALITLHLAYSPSLESAAVLARTSLPIIVLDTTPTFAYGPDQSPDELMYNHGIHGVQDMCNLLIRNGKPFKIEAGHWQKSDVIQRVVRWVRSAQITAALRRARVGQVGKPFHGMGDFAVPANVLKQTMGVSTVPGRPATIRKILAGVTVRDVEVEMTADRRCYRLDHVTDAGHRLAARVGLTIRRWVAQERLTAFTVNFLAVTRASGLPTMPFLEASQVMARGIGYAGEGDVLTAALVGALASVYPDTTFTEMFCPDWKGNRVFLSHMGEMNINLIRGKPRLVEMPWSFTNAKAPVKAVGCLRGGTAAFVNVAPLPGNRYRLIVVPIQMADVKGRNRMADMVHGWFAPPMPVADFLAEYSRLGGTHHAALVYGKVAQEIAGFGDLMGWESIIMR